MTAPRQDTVEAAIAFPWGRWWTLVIAAITALVLTLGIAWRAGAAIEGKVDREDLQSVQEKLHTIEIDVAVIKTDVAEIKAAVAGAGK